jgi:adenylate cyclase
MTRLSAVVGESAEVRSLRDQIVRLLDRVPGTRRLPPILLLGETGTGKGLLAREIHRAGPRRDAPFVDVNCAAIPETLLEAEMFGFERGAFTDARQAKPGLFEVADGGTLFLDELGYLPDSLQAKLLKVIEDRTVRRLGSTRSHPVDVSIIAATSQDLEAAVRSGRFRTELYHRLAVFTVRLPALRERGADILLLAEHFLATTCADYHLDARAFADDARRALTAYHWPGNVRELGNVVERAALLADAPLVAARDLDLPSGPASVAARGGDAQAGGMPAAGPGLPPGDDERARLVEALEWSGGNLSRAAARLGIPRNTLRYRMERHGLREAPPSRRKSPADAPGVPGAEPAEAVAPAHAAGVPPPVVRRETRRLATVGVEAPGVGRLLGVAADKLAAFGGDVEELGDDHIFAVFGGDGAEEAPRRAALAALALRRAAERVRSDRPFGAVRIAIDIRECTVGVIGTAITIDAESRREAFGALRELLGAGAPGDIVASATAAATLERRFDIAPIGELPQGGGRVYALSGPEHRGFRVRGRVTPFVGRGEELGWLRTQLRSAVEGMGHVVGIVGEAGIGKSRLVAELCEEAVALQVTCLEGRCFAYASTTPYLPVVAIVRQLCGITDGDDAQAIAGKVRAAIASADMDPARSAPYLVELLGVPGQLAGTSPEMVKARTFETLRTLVLQTSRRRPLVIVIEDLHWIDETSDALLTVLADGVSHACVLLLLTYRPGYRPSWLDRSYATQLALRPLSRDDSLAVVRSTLAAPSLSGELVQTILTRAEGNPFFLEELSRSLGDEGGERAGVTVPGTVQDVLAGRIARLEAGDSRLLQAAAVVGKDVAPDLLRAIADEPDEVVTARLQRLQAAEFLTVTSIGSSAGYTFKHALTHEVAYHSLLPHARRRLHARLVEALEAPHADRVAEPVEQLARHALGAELWEPAVRYLRRAVTRTLARSASREAVALVDQALAALEHLPDDAERTYREIALNISRGVALVLLYGYAAPAVATAYGRARELCARVGQTPRLLGALLGVWVFHLFRGDLDIARELSEQCLVVVAPFPESPFRSWAHLAAGMSLFWLGRLVEADRELEQSYALYDVEEQGPVVMKYGQDCGATSLGYLAVLSCALGRPDRGMAQADEAVSLAQRLSHAHTSAVAMSMAAATHQLRREPGPARERAEAAIALATEHVLPMWRSMGTLLRGWARSEAGDGDNAIEEMRGGITAWRALGSELAAPWFLTLLAEVLGRHGRVDEGLAAVDEALSLTARTHDRWYEPESHRVHGLLLARQKRLPEAEAALRRAVELAREREATGFELRAAVALGRFLAEDGRSHEARRLLGDVAARCAEGLDTADVATARALLARLARAFTAMDNQFP